jgi:hypothetical protein
MNIFILHNHPTIAAQMQCDKHVVKMCLETTQLLSTVAGGPYKPTHVKHPCTKWAGECLSNFDWLTWHGMALCEEYTYRYGKVHKCEAVLKNIKPPASIADIRRRTPFVQCMPDVYKDVDPVVAYRNYYVSKMSTVDMRWTKRETPSWFTTIRR